MSRAEQKAEAVDAAARLLRYGDRSRAELDERLAQKGLTEEARADALDTLERVGVVDDHRAAETRAAALAARGYGDAWIRADLRRRGLPVEDALAALQPECERAAALVARRGRGARTASWLGRRGFGEDALDAAAAGDVASDT